MSAPFSQRPVPATDGDWPEDHPDRGWPAPPRRSMREALADLSAPVAIAGISASVAIGALLRLWDLGGPAVSAGEILTAERASAPLGEGVESIAMPRNQAPLYFLALRLLPADVDVYRLASAALGVLAICLVVLALTIVTRDARIGLWSGVLFAANPLAVMVDRIARPYPLLLVLALLVVIMFFLLLRGPRTGWIWAAYTLASALALLTHYSAIALIAASAVAIAVSRPSDMRFARSWGLSQAVAAVPVIAWGIYTLTAATEVGEASEIPGPDPLTPLRTVANLLVGSGFAAEWWVAPAVALAAIGLIGGGVWAWRTRTPGPAFLLGLPLFTLVPLLLVAVIVTPKYSDRYVLVALPALLGLVAAGWLRTNLARVGAPALVLMLATTLAVSIAAVSDRESAATDWDRAAGLVAARAQPEDVLVFPRWTLREAFLAALPEGARVPETRVVLDEADPDWALPGDRRAWVLYRNPIEDFHTGGYAGFEPLTPGLSQTSDWLLEHEGRIGGRDELEGVDVIRLDPESG